MTTRGRRFDTRGQQGGTVPYKNPVLADGLGLRSTKVSRARLKDFCAGALRGGVSHYKKFNPLQFFESRHEELSLWR